MLQTAHVGALYSAFLAMMLTAGVPAVLAALSLGFMSNLFGSITHFGAWPVVALQQDWIGLQRSWD